MTGKKFLLYTTEELGRFKFAPGDPDEQIAEAKKTGLIDITEGDIDRDQDGFTAKLISPAYVMVVEVVDNWDALLQGPRPQMELVAA